MPESQLPALRFRIRRNSRSKYPPKQKCGGNIPALKGHFLSRRGPIRIRYENFRGDQLNYLADTEDAYRAGEFVIMRVAPTGRRIAFRLSSIQNRSEVESRLVTQDEQARPNVQERRILNFHLRRGSTSKLFAEVREKYPQYRP